MTEISEAIDERTLERMQRLAAMESSRVLEATGAGGHKKIILQHGSGAVAEVYLHGATVTRYTHANGQDVLWVSDSAVFDGAKAIRGGVPVVFPQFGPQADAKVAPAAAMAQHGFARTSAWAVGALTVTDAGACRAVLTLGDSAATRALWPQAFALEYEVVLDEGSLACTLKMTNKVSAETTPEPPPFAPQCLLHTYLRVADSKKTMVHGLAGAEYQDKLAADPRALVEEAMPAIRFRGELDRVYRGATREDAPLNVRPEGIRVHAHAVVLNRDDTVASLLTPDVVVWNPHVAKAARMSDFDDDGWTSMVCVEPGVLAADRPAVPPGGSLLLSQTITPEC